MTRFAFTRSEGLIAAVLVAVIGCSMVVTAKASVRLGAAIHDAVCVH